MTLTIFMIINWSILHCLNSKGIKGHHPLPPKYATVGDGAVPLAWLLLAYLLLINRKLMRIRLVSSRISCSSSV